MNPFLAILIVVAPIIGLPALLIGLFALTTGRKTPRSEPGQLEDTGTCVVAPTAERPTPAMAVDLQLTTVLAESGEVLLGYRTGAASAAGLRSSSKEVFPLATGILLVRPRDEDTGAALSILDRWCQEGIELALRTFEHGDVVVLCDRRTTQRLVLNRLWAPCN
jgi:hypothetical protein